MSKVLCIFHGGCDDGVAAAWAVRHALGDSQVEFYPGAASELAGAMAEEDGMHDFGACYFEVRPGEWQYSLRSRGNFDVSQLALRFGGGGHPKAAGFTVPDPIHRPSVP